MSNISWTGRKLCASSEHINLFEKAISRQLPSDYRRHIDNSQGRSPVPALFEVDSTERVFGAMLSFDINEAGNIFDSLKWMADRLPVGVVPFAEDPGGNYICFDFSVSDKNRPSVVFFNSEVSLSESDYDEEDRYSLDELQRDAVFSVAESFDALINMLHD